MIDWSNPLSQISNWFSVKECLWLPKWRRFATESDGLNDEIKENLILLCSKMDHIRDFFNAPIMVHSCYRPEEYNKLVNGTKNSSHIYGQAMDFSIDGVDCNTARSLLLVSLEALEMRMEDKTDSEWVHMDVRKPGPEGLYFKP